MTCRLRLRIFMARELAVLLEDTTPLLLKCFRDLEKASGGRGIDTKLIGDILQKSKKIMKELSLDPNDTTPEELYSALRVSDYRSLLDETSYVAIVIGQEMISFNLKDIETDENRNARFKYRSLSHYKKALRVEIAGRYRQGGSVKQSVVNRIIRTAFKEEI